MGIVKKLAKLFLSRYLAIKTKSVIKSNCRLNFNTFLEGRNVINRNVHILNSKIGYGTYIEENSRLSNSLIGKYCSIAQNVKVVAGRHPTKVFVTTHPAFFSTKQQAGFSYVKENLFEENNFADKENNYAVTIGNDVWIGADVNILEGVNIGDGVVIATGAVVVQDLEPYNIYGGVPAKKIGERFTEAEKMFLLNFKWWENDKKWIEGNAGSFTDIDKFIKKHSKRIE